MEAENLSQKQAFCFVVTNRSTLEMDKCEAKHYYICGEYRGTFLYVAVFQTTLPSLEGL